jgi:hypothetical protein
MAGIASFPYIFEKELYGGPYPWNSFSRDIALSIIE